MKEGDRFQRAFENAAIGISLVAVEPLGQYLEVNPTFCRMTGYSREELLARDFQSITASQDLDQNLAQLRPLLSGNTPSLQLEKRYICKDGSTFWARLYVSPVRDPQGKPLYFIVQIEDVDACKRAEQRLATQHAVTHILAESATLSNATPKILQAICESLYWEVGAVWNVDRDANVLRCAHVWHMPAVNITEFEAMTRRTSFPPGVGLPGRVWSSGEPIWIPDVLCDANFPRMTIAAQHGLHGAFAFPILFETEVKGVIEFFSREIHKPDEILLSMMAALGSQIGQFIERKRTEEALQDSEARYRLFAETASDAIITIDEESRILFINPAAEKIFGYSTAEMLGQPLTLLMPEHLRHVHLSSLRRYIETGKRHCAWEAVELTGLQKDGKEIPLEISFGEFMMNGEHFFSGIVRDITERKRAKEELKARASQQTAVAELGQRALSGMDLPLLMDEAVCLVAQTLHIEYCKVLELLPDGHALLLRAGVGWKEGLVGHATVGAKTDSQAGYTLLCKEPVIVEDLRTEIRFSGPPLLHDHGVVSGISVIISGKERPFGVLGVHTTRRRSFTADDIHFLQAVANVFAEAIERKRLEEQLRHTQKLEAIGQLAGGVAHEFNNILTALIGNLSVAIKQTDEKSDLRSALIHAEQAAHRAAMLTQQLLTFGRRSLIDLQPRDLGLITEEVVRLLRQTIDRRIEVTVESPKGLWPVLVDADQIYQVIMNLCVNARDALMERLEKEAAPGWQPMIALKMENVRVCEASSRFRPDTKPGEYVCLSASDNGCGIDEDIQHRIFEPFFTTKEVGRGTGLGLATVYGIVKQHGGWIDLTSAKNEATTFKIYLPRTQRPAAPMAKSRTDEAVAEGTETILLVDDESPIRRLGQTILEHHGYAVLLAKDGLEALEIFRRERERIQLVVLDLTMPRQSGQEVLKQLRQLNPKVKVIISSGHRKTDDAENLQSLGAVEFVPKPYRPDELARQVRRLLDQPDHP